MQMPFQLIESALFEANCQADHVVSGRRANLSPSRRHAVSVFDCVRGGCSNWRAQDSGCGEQKAASQTWPVADHIGVDRAEKNEGRGWRVSETS